MSKDLLDPRITTFVSDGDIKIAKLIKSLPREPKLKLAKDPGHVLLSISRSLRILNGKCHNIFSPLIENFEKFVKSIVLKIEDADHRVRVYKNIAAHYAGVPDQELCIHKDDSKCIIFFNDQNIKSREIFEKFLNTSSKKIYEIVPNLSTQINESFNHHSKRFLNKLYSYRITKSN